MRKPRVAVITPVHNCEKWIGPTMQAVANQTFGDLTHYIVVDSSTDGTMDAALEHAEADERAQVLPASFRSAGNSRQYGIDLSDSSVVAFVDGDDLWHPEFLEQSLAALDGHSDKVIGTYSRVRLIDESGNLITSLRDAGGVPGANSVAALAHTDGLVDADGYLAGSHPAQTASTVVLRKQALDGVRFRRSLEPVEDYDLLLRALRNGRGLRMFGQTAPMVDYRIRESQLTSNPSRLFDALDVLLAEQTPLMSSGAQRRIAYENLIADAIGRGLPGHAEHFARTASLAAAGTRRLGTLRGTASISASANR